MIPFWLKIIWNIVCGAAMFFLTIGSVIVLSGAIVDVANKVYENNLNRRSVFDLLKDDEIMIAFKPCLVIGGILAMIALIMFVSTMFYYQIPFNEWIG